MVESVYRGLFGTSVVLCPSEALRVAVSLRSKLISTSIDVDFGHHH